MTHYIQNVRFWKYIYERVLDRHSCATWNNQLNASLLKPDQGEHSGVINVSCAYEGVINVGFSEDFANALND